MDKQFPPEAKKKRSRGLLVPCTPAAGSSSLHPVGDVVDFTNKRFSARKERRRQKTEPTKKSVGQRIEPEKTNATNPTGALKIMKKTDEESDELSRRLFLIFPGCKASGRRWNTASPWGMT